MVASRRGIEKQANRAQVEQREQKYVQFRGHRLEDEYAGAIIDALRLQQRSYSSDLFGQFAECKRALSPSVDVNNGRRMWPNSGLPLD